LWVQSQVPQVQKFERISQKSTVNSQRGALGGQRFKWALHKWDQAVSEWWV